MPANPPTRHSRAFARRSLQHFSWLDLAEFSIAAPRRQKDNVKQLQNDAKRVESVLDFTIVMEQIIME
jgi:hypothetical protein